jgi:hypothetical protein
MHEAQLYDLNCFITLTFSGEGPEVYSLDFEYFQLFMKRLRARFDQVSIRYFMAGEYGELNSRAHFHACLFGFDFLDKVYLARTDSGAKLYRSEVLESLWPYGFSSVGAVTFESAAYVARYVMKKVSGSDTHHDIIDPITGEVFRRVKEGARMSLKPGIGAGWLRKFMSDVYPHGRVVVNGHESRPPRYYDKLFRRCGFDRQYFEMMLKRHVDSVAALPDGVPVRLGAREVCSLARLERLKRKI